MADLQRLKSSIAKLERLLASMDVPETPTPAQPPADQPVSLGYATDSQVRRRR